MTKIDSNSITDINSFIKEKLFLNNLAIVLLLILSITTLYWQVTYHDFINLDDITYVTENHLIKQGLTAKGISEAFTSVYASNWHPLTWISHMFDLEFFGMNPGMHHMVNVIFHTLNSILLFFILQQMTGSTLRSATVAMIFAIHPLHVESVAWIAERKDVLGAFFWMLTIFAYIRYVRLNSIKFYCLTVLCYLFGLFSKPMLVTLPFTLLLLDFWPLKRWPIPPINNLYNKVYDKNLSSNKYWLKFSKPVLEKVPLFLLSALSCGITLYAQKEAIKSFQVFPFTMRISNAAVSYITYLEKTVWPFELSIFYPFHPIHLFRIILCAAALGLISLLFFTVKKKLPYLFTGWLWYLGTLVPVIGIVQVGDQAMADRYTYIPLIGIFIMMVWGLSDLLIRRKHGNIILWITSVVVFTLLFVTTYHQIGFWKNSETIFKHSLKINQNNYMALYDLGITMEKKGDFEGAIVHYEEALRINPHHYGAHNNLGTLLASEGRTNEGIQHLLAALEINPRLADSYYNLGTIYYQNGNKEKAIEYFHKALNKNKNHKKAQESLNKAMENTQEIKN